MNLNVIAAAVLCAVSMSAIAQEKALPNSPYPYEYMRGEVVVPCPDNEKESCIWHRLVLENSSKDTLECKGTMEYDGANRDHVSITQRPMVLLPKARKAVVADTTPPDVKVIKHNLDCKVRQPPDDSKLTPKCKPTILYMPSEAMYPATSMRAGEEGPVLLEFSFTNKEGPATDIKVVGSSLWPKLDESGIAYVSQFKGYTDCKTGRFRVPVSFRLQ